MTTVSIAGLLEFIANQPAFQPVDQTDWSVCAVGEYVRSLGEVGRNSWCGYRVGEYHKDPILIELWRQSGSSSDWYPRIFPQTPKVNHKSVMDILSIGDNTTYGELQEQLAAFSW